MSYGSLYLQSEYSNQITSKIARMKQEYDKRLVHYKKNFDVNLSRIENRERSLRESMLAYIERMRSIARSRRDGIQSEHLFVRAKHIPKYPQRGPRRRRPISLDELIGRGKDNRSQAAKLERRPLSDRDIKADEKSSDALSQPAAVLLPALPERLKNSGSSVQVSFVSASDLYDTVDFSLKSKGTRQDSIQILGIDKEAADAAENSGNAESSNSKSVEKGKSFRTGDGDKKILAVSLPQCDITGKGIDGEAGDKKVDSDKEETKRSIKSGGEIDENENEANDSDNEVEHIKNNETFGKINILRLRPKRAKRMRLQIPNLRGIPEDEVISGGKTQRDSERKRMVSPPPPKQSLRSISSGRSSILSVIPENVDSILSDSRPHWSRRKEYRTIPPLLDYTSEKSTRRILMKDDGDVRIEVTQCPPKQGFPRAKMKAQKRFKKLIYLRDVPDRHSQLPRV